MGSARAEMIAMALLQPVVNATGVLLHTNLGRAPIAFHHPARYQNLELDLATGERGSRAARAGAVRPGLGRRGGHRRQQQRRRRLLLVLAALAHGPRVVRVRGESVEIGGGFRVPEVMAQSRRPSRRRRHDEPHPPRRLRAAPSRPATTSRWCSRCTRRNYRVEGFVESTPRRRSWPTLGPPVVADIGCGLLDAACPWLPGAPPAWLAGEPAARQTLAAGAALVTFSGDKLLGGPQAGIIAGRADLVGACAATRSPGRCAAAASCSPRCRRRARLPAARRRRHPVLADGGDAGRRAPRAGARRRRVGTGDGGRHRGGARRRLGAGRRRSRRSASRVDGDHLAALRAARPAGHRPRPTTGRPCSTCARVDPADDPVLAAALPALADARRRHRRPRRPRQVDARAGAHRHRPRPVRRGEAARA